MWEAEGGRKETALPMIIEAQKKVATLPEFQETVTYVETRGFWPDDDARAASRHPSIKRWFDNAGSVYLRGQASGDAMLKRLK